MILAQMFTPLGHLKCTVASSQTSKKYSGGEGLSPFSRIDAVDSGITSIVAADSMRLSGGQAIVRYLERNFVAGLRVQLKAKPQRQVVATCPLRLAL